MTPETALRRTPLFEAHRALGARMTAFAGWQMPLHYGSQLEEHRAVRTSAGVFDISHMCAVDAEGREARAALRRLLANDVAKLAAPGRALYACLLDERGGMLDDLVVTWLGGERYRLVVNAATCERDLDWFRKSAPEVAFAARRDLAMLALQGPAARETLWRARGAWRAATEALTRFSAAELSGDVFVSRTGYTGEDGFEVMLPAPQAAALWNDLVAAGAVPCGLAARDTLRLEAGMILYGQDADETVTPFEAGVGWTVDLSDSAREFIGRRALEARSARFQLLGLRLEERAVPRSGMNVRTAHGAGEVTSGTFSPTLGVTIALARLPLAAAPGDAAEIEVRGRWLSARVVKPPFVRHGKEVR
ncbi:MAG: glycine cleavage system aminomethyltransferase GcvT [Burkholderiales bacterium]|nr:glycine cleavage system aminomethyltransferase GcvT [Burkholderiales bacterium]